MWIFKEYAEENRRINSVKEDTERADGTVRIVMSAPFFLIFTCNLCGLYYNQLCVFLCLNNADNLTTLIYRVGDDVPAYCRYRAVDRKELEL